MKTGSFWLFACLATAAGNCAWDAQSYSDGITDQGGNAMNSSFAAQSVHMWPPSSGDTTIPIDAARLVKRAETGVAQTSAPMGQYSSQLGLVDLREIQRRYLTKNKTDE